MDQFTQAQIRYLRSSLKKGKVGGGEADAQEKMFAEHFRKRSSQQSMRKMKLEERNLNSMSLTKKSLESRGASMLNSSYTQACDPNTMRNFGPTRNVAYNVETTSTAHSNWD